MHAVSQFDAPTPVFVILMVFLGGGFGLVMPNSVTLVQNALDRSQLGEVTGAINFIRSLGFAIGVSTSGGLVARRAAAMLGPAGAAAAFRASAAGDFPVFATGGVDVSMVHSAYRLTIGSAMGLGAVLMGMAFLLLCTLPKEGAAEPAALPATPTIAT